MGLLTVPHGGYGQNAMLSLAMDFKVFKKAYQSQVSSEHDNF